MISMINGQVAFKDGQEVIVEAGGIGYGILVTAEDFGRASLGSDVKLYIYEHIQEKSHDLYGFSSPESKAFFQDLLSVNGIGPKMALNILSLGSLSNVQRAIAGGNAKYITGAVGVGKKVAERIVVDLKDKISEKTLLSQDSDEEDEALSALVALGYQTSQAVEALAKVKEEGIENRIKSALRILSA